MDTIRNGLPAPANVPIADCPTSANFTEAAHQRNIEAGVLISNRVAARAIRSQFEMLVTQKILQKIPEL